MADIKFLISNTLPFPHRLDMLLPMLCGHRHEMQKPRGTHRSRHAPKRMRAQQEPSPGHTWWLWDGEWKYELLTPQAAWSQLLH